MDFSNHQHHVGAKVLLRFTYDPAKAGHEQGMNPIPSPLKRWSLKWLTVTSATLTHFTAEDRDGNSSTHSWDEVKAWRFNDYAGS
jgi:hypothetical protein